MSDKPADHPERPDLPYPPEDADVILDYENGQVVLAGRTGGVTRSSAGRGDIAMTEAFLDAAGLDNA